MTEPNYAVPRRSMTIESRRRGILRKATAHATEKFSGGGWPKDDGASPKPITLPDIGWPRKKKPVRDDEADDREASG